MKDKTNFKLLLFITVFLSFLAACENEDISIGTHRETSVMEFIIPEETKDSTVFLINTVKDLQHSLTQVADRNERWLLNKGWKKVEEEKMTRGMYKARRQVRIDTAYILQPSADYYSDPSVYALFKAKFSKFMVDSINKVVSPDYRISENKTYVCRWRLFANYYNAQEGEQVATRPSPLCALVPTTKSSFKERGYSLYLNDYNQYLMNSYQLRIQWEDVSHKTIVLDIDWPFFPKHPSGIGHIGYQFIYAVSKRL